MNFNNNMKTYLKMKRTVYRAEAERTMWAYISNMSIDSGNPKFVGVPMFEKEMLKCWNKMRRLAAKNYKKTFDKVPFGLKYKN